MGTLTRGEVLRKVVHMGSGLCAFALVYLGSAWSAVLALAALGFNLYLLPRVGGRQLWRDAEHSAGRSVGILLYPLTVLLLILIFWQRLEIAAAGWGLLAFGDGMASLVGQRFGHAKLPWNRGKSWAGSIAFVVFGGASVAALLLWTAPGRYSQGFALAIAFAAALLAAALESLPHALDDNVGVPLVASLFLFGLSLTQGHWGGLLESGLWTRLLIGALVNAALAGAAYAARTVDLSGVVAGFLLGTAIYGLLDWRGFLLLLAFFVLGSACTKFGYAQKKAARLAQEKGGRRSAKHAVANAGVAAACALFAAATDVPELFALAFAGAFATAAADTASSEIGQVLGRRTYLPTTFQPVPRGTEGAVSLEGTLAGIAASAVIAGLGATLGLFSWAGAGVVVVAAFLGSMFESVVGAALSKRQLLDNEALNFLNTLVGALAAAGLAALIL